jgi:hypothetical protein
MIEYWLDADTFIKPYHEAYQFKIVPKFWEYLEQKAREQVIASSEFVLIDLERGGRQKGSPDELLVWARKLKGILFLTPTNGVQQVYKQVINSVQNSHQYGPQWIQDFVKGSDPWIIAHAKGLGGQVVTFEESVPPISKKVKIPDVAAQFGVKCINLWTMLAALNACFT